MSTWQILLFGFVPTFVYLYAVWNEWAVCRYGWAKFVAGKLVFYGVCTSAFYLFI